MLDRIFQFIFYVANRVRYYSTSNKGELQYLNLLREVNTFGNIVKGRNGYVKNSFNNHLKFDLLFYLRL